MCRFGSLVPDPSEQCVRKEKEKKLFPFLKNHMEKFSLSSSLLLSLVFEFCDFHQEGRGRCRVDPLIYPPAFKVLTLYRTLEGRFEWLVKYGPAVVSSCVDFCRAPALLSFREQH